MSSSAEAKKITVDLSHTAEEINRIVSKQYSDLYARFRAAGINKSNADKRASAAADLTGFTLRRLCNLSHNEA